MIWLKNNNQDLTPRFKQGKNSELTLVEKICSVEQQMEYKQLGKFKNSTAKKKFMIELSRYCDYEYDSKTKMFIITNIFSIPIPKSFNKFNNGISKYLIPLILNTLLNERDNNDKIEIPIDKYFTFVNWAKKINMINDNYNIVKFNSGAVSDIYNLDINNTIEFINRLTDHINYYIQQTLENLSKCAIIKYYKNPIICVDIIEDTEIDGHTVRIYKREEKRRATDEEVQFINYCETVADEKAGIDLIITNKNTGEKKSGIYQRYFGEKSIKYKKELKEQLSERNIKYTYDAYAVFMIDEKRCKDFLSLFGAFNLNSLEIEFNNFLKEFIMNNCDNRLDNKFEKFLREHQDDVKSIVEKKMKYQKELEDYNLLSDITIKRESEYIGNKLKDYRNISGVAKDNEKQKEYTVEVIDRSQSRIYSGGMK